MEHFSIEAILRNNLGLTVIIYGLISAYIISAFILKSFLQQSALNTVTAFVIMYAASVIWLGILLMVKGQPIHWLGELTGRKELAYTLGGVAGVLGWVTIASNLRLPYVVVLAGAGVVIAIPLVVTGSILSSIIVHGAYNSIVLFKASILAQFHLLVPQVLYVPTFNTPINFSTLSFTGAYSDVIWQFVLTAQAEEYLKVAIASAVMVQTVVPIKEKWIAIGVAVVLWAAIHLYLNTG